MRSTLTLGLLALLLLTGTASATPEASKDTVTLRGHYIEQFERREFYACGEAPMRYWVSNPSVVRAAAGDQGAGASLVVTVRVSPPGQHGHLGAYAHTVQVLDVVVDPAAPSCLS